MPRLGRFSQNRSHIFAVITGQLLLYIIARIHFWWNKRFSGKIHHYNNIVLLCNLTRQARSHVLQHTNNTIAESFLIQKRVVLFWNIPALENWNNDLISHDNLFVSLLYFISYAILWWTFWALLFRHRKKSLNNFRIRVRWFLRFHYCRNEVPRVRTLSITIH